MFSQKGEVMGHIVSEFKKIAQMESKRHYGNIAKFVHLKLCKKNKRTCKEKWYEHALEGVVENGNFEHL